MTRAVNDATLQKAGDIYQYLIALRDCFELNDGDTLQIETNGDVSIINDVGGRFQREVKHHFGNTSISDRDIDFWKTLANWYVDYERVKNFSNYILSTTASEKKYYRLTLLGRTGKKNPRLGEDFIKWVDEDSIIRIILNAYDYVKEYIDPNAPGRKEHIGYIVDRTGFEEFKRWALRDVTLPEIAEVMTPMYWKGITY